jgi:hypothetical protein
MALFPRKTAMQTLQAELSALTARAKLLTNKRTDAQGMLDAALEARQKMLLTGDIEDTRATQACQAKVDTATSAVAGFDAAIAALSESVDKTETQLNAERLSVERKAAADAIAINVATVERLVPAWLTSSREIVTAFAALNHTFEAGQIGGFIANAASEVEVATSVVFVELRNLPQRVAAGDSPIPNRMA